MKVLNIDSGVPGDWSVSKNLSALFIEDLSHVLVLLPFLFVTISNFFGLMATIKEFILGIYLIIRFKTRHIASNSFSDLQICALYNGNNWYQGAD